MCLAALSQRQQQAGCLVPPQVLPQPLVLPLVLPQPLVLLQGLPQPLVLSSLPAPLVAQHSQLLPLASPLVVVVLDSRMRSTDSQLSQPTQEKTRLAESDIWICCS